MRQVLYLRLSPIIITLEMPGEEGLEGLLDGHGGDVLAARGDDELLDAAGDGEEAGDGSTLPTSPE